MKHLSQRRTIVVLCIALLLGLGAAPVLAQGKHKADSKKLHEAAKEAREASGVFDEIMKAPDSAIPQELLDRAEAVAVFPKVIKAAFVVGGSGGKGVVSRRTAGGWSAPVFFKLGGGSFGAQIGAEAIDYVLLFMNEDGLKGLLKDKLELGGEVSVAAGPVGRTAAASTDVLLNAQILSYSRSKGVFAGVALKGSVISPDDDLNEAIDGARARELLLGGTGEAAARRPTVPVTDLEVFPQTLARYSRRASSSR